MAHGYLISRSGIYAAPRTLRRGQKLSREGLAVALRRAGYIETEETTDVWNGSFVVRDGAIEIRPNSSERFASVVRVTFDPSGRIAGLTGDEVTMESFTLAPESLTNDALTKGAVRRQLTFKDLPAHLIHAITSIEDRRFFEHHGLDIFGVARALIRNAGDKRIGQGGSSITQQLVKNT
ncbi:MAG TPA: transglycosylase domain-containing protein, partial [Pyrinomonadaceae bacterium]|nr:transglycosylase domain-containing protein [Pyrinomonadaceae bacterium]